MPRPDTTARKRFFDKQVHMPIWKDSMACVHEDQVIERLKDIGYNLDVDFVRQHPIGERFVIDIAFINEKVAIEVDGDSHRHPKKIASDKKRDSFLRWNDWVSIRIPERRFFGFASTYYKFLIREVVEARREQYNNGRLYHIDVPEFKDEDY